VQNEKACYEVVLTETVDDSFRSLILIEELQNSAERRAVHLGQQPDEFFGVLPDGGIGNGFQLSDKRLNPLARCLRISLARHGYVGY